MASPTRRSSRKKARVSYNEDIIRIVYEEEVEKPKRRRAPPKKRHYSDDDDSSTADEDTARKPPPPKKRRASSKSENYGRGPVSERTCPYCDQVCSTKAGLKYHVDHFVCRPELNPNKSARGKKRSADDSDGDDKPAKPKPRKGRRKGGTTKYGKDRGAKADRTCPHCNRVFTSVLGKEYHVTNKVCLNPNKTTKSTSASIPFPSLEAGSKFVTPFGVVEVVSDNRATPVAQPKSSAKKSQAKNRGKKQRHQKGSMQVAIKSRAQRGRLSAMYENGRITQQGVFKACFEGGDPRGGAVKAKAPAIASNVAIQPAPEYPEGSFPDRIVECVLIPDERTKVVLESDSDDDDDASMEVEVSKPAAVDDNDASNKSSYGMKLFLRRRTLKEPYVASSMVYNCEDCGQAFNSNVGYNYHTRSEVCIGKAKRVAAANEKFLETVEERATAMLNRRTRSRSDKKKARKNVPVYPQVWLSLGFKFVAKKPPTKPKAAWRKEEEPEESIDDVLWRLRNQLKREYDRSLGPIYPGVFDSLKFQRPPPKWKIIEEQERQVKRQEALIERKRKRLAERRKQQQKLAPPPIVDIQVLADEVDAGRYPSIKRYSGEHQDFCSICKEDEESLLFCCGFCNRCVHLECIRQKHTVKDPEPQDDFMCHNCIQYVQDRRRRAEKRRLEKQEKAMLKSALSPPAELAVLGSEGESAYHDVASLGHELRDLTELIRDAQGRLRQSIGVSKMNDVRRSMLM